MVNGVSGKHRAARKGCHRAPTRTPFLPLVGIGAIGAATALVPHPVPLQPSQGIAAVAVLQQAAPLPNPRVVVVSTAISKIGRPYVWGAKGQRDTFDCSGLTHYAWKAAGREIGLSTYDQIKSGIPVVGPPRPGDLIFKKDAWGERGPEHVQLAISATEVVEAPGRGMTVRRSPMPAGYVARRIQ